MYRVLCYLAHADGEMSGEERALLEQVRAELDLDAAEAGALEAEAQRGERLQLKDDDVEGEIALRTLAKVMLADGVLHPEEGSRLKRIAKAVGVSDKRLAKVLHRAMVRRNQRDG